MCPLLLSEASGSWLVRHGNLSVDSALTVSDRDANPRFYPLKSNDVHFTLGGDYVRATGALRHPASGNLVTNVYDRAPPVDRRRPCRPRRARA